jgi:hypothetical protein
MNHADPMLETVTWDGCICEHFGYTSMLPEWPECVDRPPDATLTLLTQTNGLELSKVDGAGIGIREMTEMRRAWSEPRLGIDDLHLSADAQTTERS